MSNDRLLARRDLEFMLYEWLKVDQLAARERFHAYDRDMFDSVLDLAEHLGTEVFAPINRLLDENEPRMGLDGRVIQPPELLTALRAFGESGLIASTFDEEIGGAQLPYAVRSACMTYLAAGSLATYAYPFLSEANAHLLVTHGTPGQIATFAIPILEGRWFGTMCLSEQQAGSSLGDITTIAVPQEDGTHRVFGSKMWISGGDHELADNIVHLVLARTPGAPVGPRGLSLFIVPRHLPDGSGEPGERNDVTLVGLNHKMGYRGTTNTLLAFGDGAHTPGAQAGAVGFLVGEVGSGLPIMFDMMNEARIGVGAGAVAVGYTGYLHSLAYARERPQGRPMNLKDASAPQVPIIDHPDVRRMLLAQKAYVEGGLALVLFCALLVDEQLTASTDDAAAEATLLLGLLTPIAKSWPSRWCLTANDLAIQVHGGYGYTRDFPVEQFYRDNRLNMIHEGTHGIQAVDLIGRKILRSSDGLRSLWTRMERSIAAATAVGGAPARHAAALAHHIAEVKAALEDTREVEALLANATSGLEAIGHVVVAWLWLEQECVARSGTGAFYEGKRSAAEYFFAHELPIVTPLLDTLRRRDRLFLDLDPNSL
ncbi:acyl-CoA dehydrogenase [Microbacterium terregens]|uniref:Acyl-CoA dehydrogenase n=1 Tax=Microbacterium terregens TaxID=69363 RepID=A0ABV5SYL9_9MICO